MKKLMVGLILCALMTVPALGNPESTAVLSVSGTGTAGATLRVYLESYESDPEKQKLDAQELLVERVRRELDPGNESHSQLPGGLATSTGAVPPRSPST